MGRHAKKATNRRRRLFPVDILLTSRPDSSQFLMQKPCQRAGNPRKHSTALIVRDLVPSGNNKVISITNIIFLLTRYGNNEIPCVCPGSVPLVTRDLVTDKVLPIWEKFFPFGVSLRCFPQTHPWSCAKRFFLTSLRCACAEMP